MRRGRAQVAGGAWAALLLSVLVTVGAAVAVPVRPAEAAVTDAALACPGTVDRHLRRMLPADATQRARLTAAHAVLIRCVTRNLTAHFCPALGKSAPMRKVASCLQAARRKTPVPPVPRFAPLPGEPGRVWAAFARLERSQGACIATMTELLQEAATARWFCTMADREVTEAYYRYLHGRAGK